MTRKAAGDKAAAKEINPSMPTNNDSISHGACKRCGATIYWHKSYKTGKSYSTNSPTDRTDFHKCSEQQECSPPLAFATPPEPQCTPFDFEPTDKERLATLEKQVSGLIRTVMEIAERLPMTDKDVPF